MRPDSGIDQTSLAWLKPEIDASLTRAGEALERYAEENFSGEGAAVASAALHEVLGGLRMLELYGAALVAEEMERVVSDLTEGKVQRVEDALTSLLRAILQLPDYLDRLQGGYRDIPIVLLPLLNDLRSCRGEKLLSESVLLIPASDPELPSDLPAPPARISGAELEKQLTAMRRDWQFALLQWFRGQDNQTALGKLTDICDRLLGVISVRQARQLWWVAGAICDAMRAHALDASISTKLLYGRLDREIKRLIDQGEVLYGQNPPSELLRNLLYYAAQAGSGDRIGRVQDVFGLTDLVPSEQEVDEARGAMSGRNSSLLGSVVGALEEELLRVKDALDLYLRGSRNDADALQPELEVLDRVADTLGMVGMGIERSQVQAQRAALADIAAGAPASEQTLLDIAGALLKVESSLQMHREQMGVQGGGGGMAAGTDSGERRRLVQAVLREAANNLLQSKELFVAHLTSPPGNTHKLAAVVQLRDVAGALRLLEFSGAADRVLAIAGYLHGDLDPGTLAAEEVDAFADALSGLEYYLELVADHQGHGEERLQAVTDALARLGHWPSRISLHELFSDQPEGALTAKAADAIAVPAGEPAAPAAAAAVDATPAPDEAPAAVADAGSGVDPTVQRFSDMIASLGFSFDEAAGMDEEIRGTFLDELTEEMASLDQNLPMWRNNIEDLERLRTIRRSYHTIKGSGRMVGARLLGEFAWLIENLLNRVLNGNRPATLPILEVVEQATATLPEFHAALCGDITPRRNIAAIMANAELLADGGTPVPMTATAAVPAAAPPAPAEVEPDAVVEPEPEAVAPVVEAVVEVDEPATANAAAEESVALDAEAEVAGELQDAAEDEAMPVAALDAGDLPGVEDAVVEAADAGLPEAEAEVVAEAAEAMEPEPQPETDFEHSFEEEGEFPALDPVLLDILRSEVAGHLGVIDTYLHDARSNSALAIVPEHLVRAVHTLNGAFGAVDLPQVTELTSTLEGYVNRLRGLRMAPITDGYDAIAASSRWLAGAVEHLERGTAIPPATELADRLTALTGELRELRPGEEWFHSEGAAIDHPESSVPGGLDDVPELEPLVLSDVPDDVPVVEETIEAVSTAPIEQPAPPTPPAVPETPAIAAATAGPVDVAPGSVDRNALRAMLAVMADVDSLNEVDPDLAELFREEAREILDRCEQHLAGRDRIGPAALSQELARELHTLKGGARMAGFTDAGELGHAMESLLESANNDMRELGDADIGLLGRCLDQLNYLIFPGVDKPSTLGATMEMEAEGATFEETVFEDIPTPAAETPATTPPVEAAPPVIDIPAARPEEPIVDLAVRSDRPRPTQIDIHAEAKPEAAAPEAQVTEFVRVRADQLDSLVNLAGEVGIIRTRLEQQVGAFRFSLEEFEQTVLRLREQLRKLEIEAETQILSREVRVQEQSGSSGFDPLEMDRFSQLQQLSRALAESMSDLQSIQGLLDEHTRLAESLLLQQSRAGAELQEGLMRARMVPFESMLPRLRRLVRQEADAMGKRVRLDVEGAQGELDRGVLERMAAPFEHMLRNALVHGLETPDQRRAENKPEEGEIRIRVAREATEVLIEVSDDGRGIDPQRVRKTAIERGLLSAESDLSDRDLYGFILEAGFSTASELTQYAGRGVGMDVVASEIKQLGGSLTIDSTVGKGATFRVRLPYTLAVSQAVLVKVTDHTFAIPMTGVQGIVRLSGANYKQRVQDPRPKVDYAGEDYEIYELDNVLAMTPGATDDSAQVPLLMIRAGDLRVALRVDALLGGREIVVKPVGPQLARIPGVFGATILGDGAVVVILDVAALLRRAAALREKGDAPVHIIPQPLVRQRPVVMVVDDSITMRKVSARVLEREGYEVATAKDGMDALEQVNERVPDVILLDLEMPRMDGYEFAGYMRADDRFKSVPIIVITSRMGEKHRARAFEIGVNRYLGKPYQEADMLKAVEELLEERRLAQA